MFHRPNATQPSSPSTPQEPQGNSKTMTQSNETESASASETRSADIPANPFQRPNASAPAAPAARPATPSYGAFPSYGSGSSASPSLSNGRRLVIGQGITMSGEIESCDHLVVEGTVEAALKGASVLEIAETGMFYGTVEISEATIAGKFEGEITVNGRLTVRSTGSITGAISYKELAVESGATIDGKINPVGGSRQASEKKSQKPKVSEDLPILRAAGQ
jgi:cytoskeletal protein CcmA (bactofilin family)